MRQLLLGLAMSLPLVASAVSPSSAYDDSTYPSRDTEAIAVQQIERAPNHYDDAGMNGPELKATARATKASEARSTATMAENRCRCS